MRELVLPYSSAPQLMNKIDRRGCQPLFCFKTLNALDISTREAVPLVGSTEPYTQASLVIKRKKK